MTTTSPKGFRISPPIPDIWGSWKYTLGLNNPVVHHSGFRIPTSSLDVKMLTVFLATTYFYIFDGEQNFHRCDTARLPVNQFRSRACGRAAGAQNEKRVHPKTNETQGFLCCGHSNWTIRSPLSPFCCEIFPTFSLSYWGALSYYPRGLIMGKGNSPNFQ